MWVGDGEGSGREREVERRGEGGIHIRDLESHTNKHHLTLSHFPTPSSLLYPFLLFLSPLPTSLLLPLLFPFFSTTPSHSPLISSPISSCSLLIAQSYTFSFASNSLLRTPFLNSIFFHSHSFFLSLPSLPHSFPSHVSLLSLPSFLFSLPFSTRFLLLLKEVSGSRGAFQYVILFLTLGDYIAFFFIKAQEFSCSLLTY